MSKNSSLSQLAFRSFINLINLAVLGLILYCTIKFDQTYKLTFAATVVALVYNSLLSVAFWKHFRGQSVAPGGIFDTTNYPRIVMSDFFIFALGVISTALLGIVQTDVFHPGRKGNRQYKADPWRLIAFGLQLGAALLQFSAIVWTCTICTRARKKYMSVATDV